MALDGVLRTDPLIGKPASRLYAAITRASKIDPGTGSTFDALAARRLVQVQPRSPDGYPHLVPVVIACEAHPGGCVRAYAGI